MGIKLTGGLIVGAVVAFIALAAGLGSFYTVDQSEQGLILRNGAISSVEPAGFHGKMPFIDKLVRVSMQSYNRRFDKVEAYSRDQQPADVTISVNYRVDPSKVPQLYSQYQTIENLAVRVLDPRLLQQLKNVTGQFNAASAIQERSKLNAEVQDAFITAVQGTGAPVIVESVQIENIVFSQAYEDSVEARMLAEVEVAKLKQNAEREKVQAEITVIQAQAQADAVKAKAEADAQRINAIGAAEANAIKARGDALRENPDLIRLTAADKWDGKLPATMVPGQTVPFLTIPNNP